MAKTRRKKINRSPSKPYGSNCEVGFVEPGIRVQVAGHREGDKKMIPSKDARPVFIGRTYTGKNTGKVYPYASKKRGGAPS